jgi:Tol biopolymer transport system component
MPDTTAPRRYTFEQLAAIYRYQPALAFSPDGAQIAYSSNASGQFNLWRQPTAGGEAVQLTDDPERAVRDIAWSPDGSTILYTADHQGDEFHQLYLIPSAGGDVSALTDAPEVQHYLAVDPWAPDSARIAYAGNDREPTDQDVLVRDLRDGSTRRVLAGDALYFPIAWSPDGQSLTATDEISNSESRAYLVPAAAGEARLLTPAEGEVRFFPGPWAADGSGFYLLTDEGREFLGLAYYDLATGSYRWLETPDWDIESVDASRDGRLLAWVVNEDGYFRLHVRDLTTGELVALPDLPGGVIGMLRVSPDGGKIGLLLTRPRHPAEIVILDLATREVRQLTSSAFGSVDEADLIEP